MRKPSPTPLEILRVTGGYIELNKIGRSVQVQQKNGSISLKLSPMTVMVGLLGLDGSFEPREGFYISGPHRYAQAT